MKIEMGGQNYSIEFFVSFPTIYHYVVCDDGKVPAKIVLLYGGKSSYGRVSYRGGWNLTKVACLSKNIYQKLFFFQKKKYGHDPWRKIILGCHGQS